VTLAPETVGTVQAVAGVLAVAFLYPPLKNRETPGSRPFALFVAAIALWAFGVAAGNFSADSGVSRMAYAVVLVGVS
jgi:hypothetical protein